MFDLVVVFLGGGAGAVCRYLGGVGYMRVFGPNQPHLATLIINVLGGLLMGVLVGWLAHRAPAGAGAGDPLAATRLRLLLGVGVLGGFTTFSTFSLEAVGLLQRRAFGVAAGYVLGSVVLSILALALGLVIMRRAAA